MNTKKTKTVYELALEYYPRLWDKSRLDALVEAGRLTEEEMANIIASNTNKW